MDIIKERAIWLVLILFMVYCVKKSISHYSYRVASRGNGCSSLSKYPHKDPILGLDLFFDIVRSIKQGNTIDPDMRRFKDYGKTYQARSWGSDIIFTMDSENMQTMFTSAFDNFGVASLRYGPSVPLLGHGIFTTDGPQWEHSRNLIKPIFARAQISDLTYLEKHVERMIDCIPRDNSTIDLQHLAKLLFLDEATEFLFGESTDSLLGKSIDSDVRRLLVSFDTAMSGIHTRWLLGKFSILLGPQREYKQACKEVHEVIEKYIDRAICKQKSGISKHSSDEALRTCVLLDDLVAAGVDRAEIRDQVLGVFFPARDSTALGISNIFFYLARHPRAWNTLRSEILAIDQPLTFEYLKSLKFLRYVINEAFRLVLPASRSLRTCIRPTVLPRGGGPTGKLPILVQPGTQIDTNFRAMHLDPSIWGQDAASFRPERWEGLKPMWEYIPFLGGKRMCPAQQMVLTQTAYVVVRILQEFREIENRDPEMEYVEKFTFTMESKNGVQVGLIPA